MHNNTVNPSQWGDGDNTTKLVNISDEVWAEVAESGFSDPHVRLHTHNKIKSKNDKFKTTYQKNIVRRYTFNTGFMSKKGVLVEVSLSFDFDVTFSRESKSLEKSIIFRTATIPNPFGENKDRTELLNKLYRQCIDIILARETLNKHHDSMRYDKSALFKLNDISLPDSAVQQIKNYAADFAAHVGADDELAKQIKLSCSDVECSNDVNFFPDEKAFSLAVSKLFFEEKLSKLIALKTIEKSKTFKKVLTLDILDLAEKSAQNALRMPERFPSDVAYDYYLYDLMKEIEESICQKPMQPFVSDIMVRHHHTQKHLLMK